MYFTYVMRFVNYYVHKVRYLHSTIIESERVRGEKGDEGDQGSNRATNSPASSPHIEGREGGMQDGREAGRQRGKEAGP